MHRIYLIRHGQVPKVPGDPALTAAGRLQAELAGDWLRDKAINAIYSSPLTRAIQTAEIIGSILRLPVRSDPRLRERMNWGDVPNESVESFRERWQKASVDRRYSPPNSDSSIAAAERVKAALRDYRDQWPTGNVAVVTHQDTLIDLLRSLLGDSDILSRKSNLLTAGVENCSITILEFYGESYSLKRFEMTDHLQPLSTDASPARPTAPRYG